MPELPEVETVRCQLAGSLEGMTFSQVIKAEPAMLHGLTEKRLVQDLPGRTIQKVDRRGKFLIIELDAHMFLTLHLGMTGHLLVDPRGVSTGSEEPARHTRFVFALTGPDGRRSMLEFRDMRKFGRLDLTMGMPAGRIEGLGPDAWRGDWDESYLEGRLRGRKAPLKAFLLDQRHLSGIGNIYADEILWWTELSPLRASGSLTKEDVHRLAGEIRRRLGEGVKRLGCSISDFVDTDGNPGSFQNWLRAYGKQGQKCPRCGDTFVRVVVAGRGTTYSPGCQH